MNLDKVTRVEVTDATTGRVFVGYFDKAGADAYLQDDGRTLKVFTTGTKIDYSEGVKQMFLGFILIVFSLLGMAADGIDPPAGQYETFASENFTAVPEYTPAPATSMPVADEAIVQQIARDNGVLVSVYLNECTLTPGALACYLPDKNVIFITKAGMDKGMSYIPCILSHENRHVYQNLHGLIAYDSSGKISNREWLEKDAEEHEVCN